MTFSIFVFIGILTVLYLYNCITRKIPSRLRAEDAPKSPFGLFRADEFSPEENVRLHGVDIIFVHGLGSNPDTTWGSKDSNLVSDFFLRDLPTEFHKKTRVFFYNYDSYWKRDAVQGRLSLYGRGLLDHICMNIRKTDNERTRSLVFVAHSYGGLVVKQALVLAKTNSDKFTHIAEHTKSVFFLGTPHRGSNFSTFGSLAAWAFLPLGSNPALLKEVSYDSIYLLDLHRQFETIPNESLRILNFFEQRKTRLLKLGAFQWEEICVQEQSATFGRADSIGLEVDHYGLNKFATRDASYKMILGKLLELIKSITSARHQKLFSVPPSKIETYTERQMLSAAIAEKLQITHEKGPVPRALVVHGLGGSGKTQLALKYIEDYKAEYNAVLWIDAKDERSTRSSFERCATDLRLEARSNQESNLSDCSAVVAVREWLENQKEDDETWLMVIDNADNLEWEMKKIIPKGIQGSILITTRDSKAQMLLNGKCEELHVDALKLEEARALLLRHLELDSDSLTKDVLRNCDKVTERLGYLALAVGLAGAYIANSDEEKPEALRQYLIDFSKNQDDMLKLDHYRGLSDHEKTVWTVWDTTLEKIEIQFPGLRPDLMLPLLSRFEGEVVQDELLRLASLELKKVFEVLYPHETVKLPGWFSKSLSVSKRDQEWDDYRYRECKSILVRYNLIHRVNGTWRGVSMHKLVQWRARRYAKAQLSEILHLTAITSACMIMSKEEASPHFRRELLAHLPLVSEKRLDRLQVGDTGKDFIWNTFRQLLYKEGRWKEAEKLDLKLVRLSTEILGEEHPATLTTMANLAATYRNQGQWDKAEALQSKELQTCYRVLGPEHPETLDSITGMALLYSHQERWEDTEELALHVLKARTKLFGKVDPDTLDIVQLLASTYRKQGSLDKAETIQTEHLQNCLDVYGKKHPITLLSKYHLASTYSKQGRWAEAEPMQVQVMEARVKVLGSDHHHTLASMADLAQTYWYQERWEDAEKLEVQVLKTRTRLFGANDPNTLDSVKCLASTYRNQGKLQAAEELEGGKINLDNL